MAMRTLKEKTLPRAVRDNKILGVCTPVAHILAKVGPGRFLKSHFKWTGDNLFQAKFSRLAGLCVALGKAAKTLKHLDLQFYVHETDTMVSARQTRLSLSDFREE
jgi:hypothetical protein